MTHNPHRIRKQTASRPARRGFATLLYSYFIVSFLLMYTMTLMARSSTELHNAERDADLRQAFWAAEGELEASIANLRLTVPPTLADAAKDPNGCQDYASRTLTTDGVSSRSRLCGTSATNNYILEATGTSGSTNHVVSAVITYQADTLQFTQVALAQNVSLAGYTTGFVKDGYSEALSASSVRDTNADVSTTESKPYYYFHPSDPSDTTCEPQTWPWVTSVDSKIGGRIQVGLVPGDPRDPKMVKVVGHPPQGRGNLESLPNLPDIEVPSQAVSLGSLNVGTVGSTESGGAGRMCLASGTYKATSVNLSTDSELCTVGPVSLYVTGGGDSNSVWLAPGARIYGQPKTRIDGHGANEKVVDVKPYDGVYVPANLRLFVKDGTVWLGQNGSLAAAVVYAPRSLVIAPTKGTLLGSIMAWEVNYGPPVPWSGAFNTGLPNYLVYDQTLGTTKIPVGPVNVAVKMWGEGVTAEQQLAQFLHGTAVTSRTTTDANSGKWPGTTAQWLHDRAAAGLAVVQPAVDACHAANAAAEEVNTARKAADSAAAHAQEAEEAHNYKKAAKEAGDAAQAADSAAAAANSAQASAQAAANAAASATYADVASQASAKAAQASSAASEASQAAQDAAASAAAAQAAADAAKKKAKK